MRDFLAFTNVEIPAWKSIQSGNFEESKPPVYNPPHHLTRKPFTPPDSLKYLNDVHGPMKDMIEHTLSLQGKGRSSKPSRGVGGAANGRTPEHQAWEEAHSNTNRSSKTTPSKRSLRSRTNTGRRSAPLDPLMSSTMPLKSIARAPVRGAYSLGDQNVTRDEGVPLRGVAPAYMGRAHYTNWTGYFANR